ncbi:MAG: hypothetical protein ACXW2T_05550 [Allosphingosinicella sp.]
MRPVFAALFYLPILALAACESEAVPTGNSAAAEAGSPGNMELRLEGLAQGQRDAVFLRAIRDAHGECQHVETSERAGENEGLPVWRARCEQARSYTIVITPGGTAQVLDDSQARLSHEAPPKEGGRGQ